MLVYPSSTDLSSRTLRYLTGRLVARRREIGTRWRRLAAGRQALLALATLAPDLTEAMTTASVKAFAILDGTLLPIDRVAADTPHHSGKHKRHGMNVQVLTDRSAGCCGNTRRCPARPTESSTRPPRRE